MKIQRDSAALHPIIVNCIEVIQHDVIDGHKMPIRLFESGRVHERHNMLIQRGKTKDIVSRHLYNLDNDPPLYATAVDYVFYDGRWSWNLRDASITAWYILFGNLVLDKCPALEWGGQNRKSTNYCHFQLRASVLIDALDEIPCVVP